MHDFHNNTPIILDFETYYDDEYSLKKITTEEYIRDPRFQCIGMSIKHRGATEFYQGEGWMLRLASLMEQYPDAPVGSHNAMFDIGILGLRYNIHPNNIADTVSMAASCGLSRRAGRASLSKIAQFLQSLGYNIPSKGGYIANMKGVRKEDMSAHDWLEYAEYCKKDTDICAIIYTACISLIPDTEMRMMSETIRMFSKPAIQLNLPMLETYAIKLEQMRVDNLVNLTAKFGFADIEVTQSHLRSRPKFQKLLEACNVEIPMKVSPTTGKTVPALSKKDEEYMALLEHSNPTVRQLIECRLNAASTLEQTRCARFIGIAGRGLMPVPLKYASAHTYRYGGGDRINLQNLRKRSGDITLRRSMGAPEGSVVMASDSSQIEARLLAYMANETYMIDIFISRQCPYSDMAAKIYNKTYDDVYHAAKVERTKEGIMHRNVGKETVLGAGFGMGSERFTKEMNLKGLYEAAEMAETIIATYRHANPNIKALWNTAGEALAVMLSGGTMSFGGPNGDLFYATGCTEFWGKVIPAIRLPDGNYIFYENLRKQASDDSYTGWEYVYDQFKGTNWAITRVYGGKVVENLTQAIAFSVLKYQALRIVDRGVPVHLNVHDEWVSIVPKSHARNAAIAHALSMREVPYYIPEGLLDCEVDIGLNYADTRTVEGL